MEKNVCVLLSCIGMISSFILGSDQRSLARVGSLPDISSPGVFLAEGSFDQSMSSVEMNPDTPSEVESLVRWASQTPEGKLLLDALKQSQQEQELQQERAVDVAVRQAETFFTEELAKQARYMEDLEQRVRTEKTRASRWKGACCGTGCVGTAVLCVLGCLGYIG